MQATNSIIFMITLLILLQHVAAQNDAVLSSPAPSPSRRVRQGLSFHPRLKLSPSMAIILICLISAFFVMGCVSLYVRHCAERGLADDLFDPEDLEIRRRHHRAAARGLDPTIVDSFPMFLYSDVKGLKLGKGALECAVCLNELEDGEILRLLPQCSHVFHPDCIDAWLASHVTCPVCRANLTRKDGEPGDSDSLSHHLGNESSDPVVPAHEVSNSASEIYTVSEITNENLPPRSASKSQRRSNGEFLRSHTTGHSLIQPGEDCERFTLRLSEEARIQLMRSTLTRTKSCDAFPRARSTTKGYRSNSAGPGRGNGNPLNYERFDGEIRADRWGLFSSVGSTRSLPKENVNGEEITVAQRNLFRSVRTPFDRLFGGKEKDNDRERSFNRLRDENSV